MDRMGNYHCLHDLESLREVYDHSSNWLVFGLGFDCIREFPPKLAQSVAILTHFRHLALWLSYFLLSPSHGVSAITWRISLQLEVLVQFQMRRSSSGLALPSLSWALAYRRSPHAHFCLRFSHGGTRSAGSCFGFFQSRM